MKITFENGALFLYLTENTFIHSRFEWKQLFWDLNWATFTPIKIYFERDYIMGGIEMEVMVLGIGFRFRHNIPGEMDEDMEESLEELKKTKLEEES